MRHVIRHRRWRDDEAGMSLIEIMIAVFVLGVGLLALASTAIVSIVNLRISRGRQEATDAASALIEDLRRTDYATVALDRNDPDVVSFVQANGGTASGTGGCDPVRGEPLVTSSQAGAIPRHQPFGPSGNIEVTTTVTWYDDDGDGACPDADDRKSKRVKVVATWDDGDRTFTVEESTLIAPVDRGLPAPDFRLGTPNASVVFTESDRDNAREQCVGHVLRNLGAEDSYEFNVVRVDGGGVSRQGDTLFHSPSGSSNKWSVRAFFEAPPQEPPLDPATLGLDPTHNSRDTGEPALELFLDAIGDGNDLPENLTRLAAGEQGRLWICYRSGTNLSVGDTAEFEIEVQSEFDPNRVELLSHEVEVTNDFTDLYLFDDYPGEADGSDPTTAEASTPRVVQGNGGNEELPALSMGPETTLEPELLGSTPELPNYDTDFDSYPGTRLLDAPRTAVSEGDWPASTIAFHQQVTPATTFGSNVTLDFWSASQEALDEAADGDTTMDSSVTLDYRVSLQVLKSNEKNVEATIFSETFSETTTAAGFHPVSVTFSTPGFTVANNEYLRLEIECIDTSEVCHIAYDHDTYPARLRLLVEQ